MKTKLTILVLLIPLAVLARREDAIEYERQHKNDARETPKAAMQYPLTTNGVTWLGTMTLNCGVTNKVTPIGEREIEIRREYEVGTKPDGTLAIREKAK